MQVAVKEVTTAQRLVGDKILAVLCAQMWLSTSAQVQLIVWHWHCAKYVVDKVFPVQEHIETVHPYSSPYTCNMQLRLLQGMFLWLVTDIGQEFGPIWNCCACWQHKSKHFVGPTIYSSASCSLQCMFAPKITKADATMEHAWAPFWRFRGEIRKCSLLWFAVRHCWHSHCYCQSHELLSLITGKFLILFPQLSRP